jgi:citrate synthase
MAATSAAATSAPVEATTRAVGAASTLAHRFLAEALTDPVAALAERLRAGTPIPGFGHRIYRTRDPRTALVLDLLGDVRSGSPSTPSPPGWRAGPAGFPTSTSRSPPSSTPTTCGPTREAIFAIARMVGWIAHALEEYAEPGLQFRAEGVYVGPAPEETAGPIRVTR